MRKATATLILVAVLSTSSAFAAPNDSSDRGIGPIQKIVRFIKHLLPINPFDTIQPIVPQP